MTTREPTLEPVRIADLRPMQMTIGYREVEAKRAEWRARADDGEAGHFLGRHMIPVVKGPKGKAYVTDHHHLARALLGSPALAFAAVFAAEAGLFLLAAAQAAQVFRTPAARTARPALQVDCRRAALTGEG